MYHLSTQSYAGEGSNDPVEMSHQLAIDVLSLAVKPISGESMMSTGKFKLSTYNQRATSVRLKAVRSREVLSSTVRA